MSHLLYWKLLNLQMRYRFERIAIVAHSMGGLVARRFALDQGAQFPQWRLFVSLSTPWAGEPRAEAGVKYSPAVVPSWRDLQPDGPFMQSLFGRRLPASIEYDLLFGHRGGYNLLRPTSDGTVTLASQLRRAAQAEARLVMGFDEDHDSILSSPQVAEQLWALLGSATAPQAQPAGRVRVALRVDGTAPPGALATLWLRAADGARAGNLLVIAAGDAEAALGPLPPGRHRASLFVDGFAAAPQRVEFDVTADSMATLAFRLQPSGMLSGYIGDERMRAAGSYHAPADSVRIRSIDLTGPNVQRTLQVHETGLDAALERVATGQDILWGVQFAFNDLPAGEYELRIDAEGFVEHRSRHLVVPGRPGAIAPIVLQARR
jgi:pimeloyl-ACP methyl ester carboxylesterase